MRFLVFHSLNCPPLFSLPYITFHCSSLPFFEFHCLSLPFIVFHCVPLLFIVFLLPSIAFHCLSLHSAAFPLPFILPSIAFHCLLLRFYDDITLPFISNNTEPEKSPKSPKTDREFVIFLLDHDAEHNEEDKLSAAAYCAVCTFCAMKVTGCAVKGLESLLVYCKDKFTLAMEKLFAKDNISVESIEKHCIKICLGIQFENQLENLVQRIESR